MNKHIFYIFYIDGKCKKKCKFKWYFDYSIENYKSSFIHDPWVMKHDINNTLGLLATFFLHSYALT